MTVIDYIYNRKGTQHELFLMLHNFISENDGIKTSLKWGIPFYNIKRTICYANPPKTGGVELVFWNGSELAKDFPSLDQKTRKRMAGLTFHSVEDIDFELLDKVIIKAIQLDSNYK